MNRNAFDNPTANVQGTTNAFRDDFPGNALNAKWDSPILTGAATTVVSGSNLMIILSAAAGDSAILTNKVPFSVPCRFSAALMLSARNASQEVCVELFSLGGSYARWKFDGTTNTTGKTGVKHVDAAGETSRTIGASSASRIYTIDLGYDDVRFSQFDLDSVTNRVNSYIHTAKVPPSEEDYFIRITAKNTAATAACVITLDFAAVQDINELMVEVAGSTGCIASALSLPVYLTNNPMVQGPASHDAVVAGNPLRVAGVARTSITPVSATADTVDVPCTMYGYPIVKPYSIPEYDWTFACAAAVANTTDVVLTEAGAAGIRNYLTGLQLQNTNAVATAVVVKDDTTVIWRGYLPASMTTPAVIGFRTPLKGTAATALNFACITTGASVYVNAQGYKAP